MALLKQILAINSGSSSLKLSLFSHGSRLTRLADGQIKGIFSPKPKLELSFGTFKENREIESGTLAKLLKNLFNAIINGLGENHSQVAAIGHRFVHGGELYCSSTRLNAAVLSDLEALSPLAPLHNPPALEAIKSAITLFGETVPQMAVFDTAFHSQMPKVASHYAIDKELALKYQIRRYGFHGTSHAFLWQCYAKEVGEEESHKHKVITLHLGNGCSMTAINGGCSIDTSMGFSPLEGLVMGTRSGDVDASIVELLCAKENKTPSEALTLLNFQSGLLGLSQLSSDMQQLLQARHNNLDAKFALDLFCYRIIKYIGAYTAALKGINALIFSGGIGENAHEIRSEIVQKLAWMGALLDEAYNVKAVQLPPGTTKRIHANNSSLAIYVIGTDENLYIAQQAASLI